MKWQVLTLVVIGGSLIAGCNENTAGPVDASLAANAKAPEVKAQRGEKAVSSQAAQLGPGAAHADERVGSALHGR